MTSIAQVLKEHPFFKDFAQEHIDKILEDTVEQRFNPGQYLFREGEDANRFYLVMRGMISLEIYVPNRGPVTIERIDSGDVVGWSWLYPPHRWHFDARAQEEVLALVLDGTFLRELSEKDHEFGYHLMRRIALVMEHRLQATRLKMMEVYDIYKESPEKLREKWQNLF